MTQPNVVLCFHRGFPDRHRSLNAGKPGSIPMKSVSVTDEEALSLLLRLQSKVASFRHELPLKPDAAVKITEEACGALRAAAEAIQTISLALDDGGGK